MTTEIDVAAALNQLRNEVRARREKLHGGELAELRGVIKQVNERWNVSAHLPITWDRPPLIGRAIAYAKRATRLLLRWYINPIVEQQNNYNAAVSRALLQINAYLEQLTREGYDLEQRLAALEKLLEVEGHQAGARGQGLGVGDNQGDSRQSKVESQQEPSAISHQLSVRNNEVQNPQSEIQNLKSLAPNPPTP